MQIGLLNAPAHPDQQAAARAEAAKYRGVSYHKRNHAFEAQLQVRSGPGYIGQFKSATQAAEAYDREVRRMYPDDSPDHKFRRKNLLNFPSEEEAAYHETPEEARKRAMKTWGSNNRKEAISFELLKEALEASVYSENYELVRLTGSSKADALLKLRGSSKAGLPIQLKAATSRWKQGRIYFFCRLLGYDGMLVVLVALDGGHFWVAAGEELKVERLSISLGCESDTDRRVENIVLHLVSCFKDSRQFPHISIEEAERDCSPVHWVERAAHRQLRSLFSCMTWSLTCPDEHGTAVDPVLEVGIGGPVMRLQEKASRLCKANGRYQAYLCKSGGLGLQAAYTKDDFDLLVACVLSEDYELQGVFLIPMSKLVQEGLVANGPRTLRLHPPWSPPKRNRTREKYAWQSDFFLDLRGSHGSSELADEQKLSMNELISKALGDVAAKRNAEALSLSRRGRILPVTAECQS